MQVNAYNGENVFDAHYFVRTSLIIEYYKSVHMKKDSHKIL